MATLYGYKYDVNKKAMYCEEVEVVETEKQYSLSRDGGRCLPFLYKKKLLKTELGKVNVGFSQYVVYLAEANGLLARQIMIDHIRGDIRRHENALEGLRNELGGLTEKSS